MIWVYESEHHIHANKTSEKPSCLSVTWVSKSPSKTVPTKWNRMKSCIYKTDVNSKGVNRVNLLCVLGKRSAAQLSRCRARAAWSARRDAVTLEVKRVLVQALHVESSRGYHRCAAVNSMLLEAN